MAAVVLLVIAAVTLSSPFGEASASAVESDDGLSVTVEVRVDPAFAADFVVVHVLNPDGQETIPLGRAASGAYGGTFRVPPANRAVVFEAGRADDFALSETVSLIDLGVEASLLQTTFTPEPTSSQSRDWGWLAVAGAAVVALVALGWAAWPRKQPTAHALVDTSGREAVVVESD